MAIETSSNRREEENKQLEKIEKNLKAKLGEQADTMHVKGWGEATLLEIYSEWMDYLVKEYLKWRKQILLNWRNFLLMRNTDIVADIVKAFFAAKRRYGRDLERWEIKWEWFALCDNYSMRYRHNDEDLIISFFSSYSWAERRIYNKIVEGKVLADTSKSLLEVMRSTEEEMLKKEADKKRREEEKRIAEAEKQQRKEERAKKAEEKKRLEEEKKRKREEKKARKAEEKKLKNASKSKNVKAVDGVIDEQEGDDREPDVDPDYPKPQEWWRDPVQPWTESSDSGKGEYGQNEKKNNGKKGRKWWKKDDGQLSFDFWEE